MSNLLLILLVLLVLLAVSVVVFVFLLRESQKPKEAKPDELPNQRKSLESSFSRAVAALRAKVPGGKSLDHVPWVLMIGEPGAGKTTILDQFNGDSTEPATDGIQWRFLDGGAVIDVPGEILAGSVRQTHSDSRWRGFLRLLVRHRPSRPVNGIVIAIPADRLLAAEAAVHQNTSGAEIRTRLDEAQTLLGLAVPIYILVTKCDLIPGFGSFCWEIAPDQDDDIFGWSNANTLESTFAPEWVDEAFDFVKEGILRQQMRVFGSRAAAAADEFFIFPQEFERMRGALREYLTQIFRETSYIDSNFLRGIFFCGDPGSGVMRSSPIQGPAAGALPIARLPGRGAAPLTGASGSAVRFPGLPARIQAVLARRQIVFVRQLFDCKILLESTLARPVTGIRLSRNRTVLAAQSALLIFVVVFGLGTAFAWLRLAHLRDQRFIPLLNELASVPAANGGKRIATPVQTAYDLVDSMDSINASGFRAFFLPASWNDPIGARVAALVTNTFSGTVFNALRTELMQRQRALVGSCESPPPAADAGPKAAAVSPGPSVSPGLSFVNDPSYAALDSFLREFSALETAGGRYNNLARPGGSGTVSDLDALFQYLIGKSLTDPNRTNRSTYFRRAIYNATANTLPATDNDCVRKRVDSLIDDFYESWFDNNPLLAQSDAISGQIADLENGKLPTRDEIASLIQDIRDLDATVSAGTAKWLTMPQFEPNFYPAFAQMRGMRFADASFVGQYTAKGEGSLADLKEKLLASGPAATGAILEAQANGLHVSGTVIALEQTLASLLSQNFAVAENATLTTYQYVIWNKAALGNSSQFFDSYQKFIKERLPVVAPGFRSPIQQIAIQFLNQAVSQSINQAQAPQTGQDETTTLLEINSFKDAMPVLVQLQQSAPGGTLQPKDGIAGVLSQQSMALAKRLNSILDSNPPYPYAVTSLRTWDGLRPLSSVIFGVDSPDALEQYLATERERVHSLATEYAQPVAAYLQPHGLQSPAQFDRWASIIRDVRDYDAKKPNNPIASLESFIRTNLDKITPANSCSATESVAKSTDYFLGVRSDIEQAARNECSTVTLARYTTKIADFFNSKLAGKFPFGTLPAAPGAPQADPHDAAEFLSRLTKQEPALSNFLAQNPAYAELLTFVNQSDAVRQMMAGGLADGALYTDFAVYFRTNQTAEKNGNEIIEWVLESGDQKVQYPGVENSLRWHYGDRVHLTLRYAKDSPDYPQPGVGGSDARVDGRSVSWDYPGGWSLFALLSSHGGATSGVGTSAADAVGTLQFVIPTLPDTSRIHVPAPTPVPGQTSVFLKLALRLPGGKVPVEAPIAPFPVRAPLVPSRATNPTE